ncbi:hypothetical protein [Rhizobium terrae]|uniref:hypothetical protein n=1 Tax=Rhizobium terrae TaxID=2171756 RepID=UPI0013C2B6BB|nr:hypothetical protein [Rhizobium terrae]
MEEMPPEENVGLRLAGQGWVISALKPSDEIFQGDDALMDLGNGLQSEGHDLPNTAADDRLLSSKLGYLQMWLDWREEGIEENGEDDGTSPFIMGDYGCEGKEGPPANSISGRAEAHYRDYLKDDTPAPPQKNSPVDCGPIEKDGDEGTTDGDDGFNHESVFEWEVLMQELERLKSVKGATPVQSRL